MNRKKRDKSDRKKGSRPSKITILMASVVGLSTTPQDYKFSAGVQFRQNCFGEMLVFPERLISWRDQNLQLNISAELDLWKVKLPPAELASLVAPRIRGGRLCSQ